MTALSVGKSGHIPQEPGRLPQRRPDSTERMNADPGRHGLSNDWHGCCYLFTEHLAFICGTPGTDTLLLRENRILLSQVLHSRLLNRLLVPG
ncbi:hypothetical protein [Methylococcus sp. Mc7]|uniref:hypothetical protein n=1 Tax=Methylococcus sp. Mc7 TaxID=2860258 RepID=UPI001C52DB35|nr:hypothetical protein [Methylococcus sp. Mc7]QXP84142.1 hypothetical protein KW115_18875 [Methylococcus sp. Mc7]